MRTSHVSQSQSLKTRRKLRAVINSRSAKTDNDMAILEARKAPAGKESQICTNQRVMLNVQSGKQSIPKIQYKTKPDEVKMVKLRSGNCGIKKPQPSKPKILVYAGGKSNKTHIVLRGPIHTTPKPLVYNS